MKNIILFFFIFFLTNITNSQLHTPIEGVYGREYIIVNYVDWGISFTIKDGNCGTKSYNGHQGTDFVIRSFPLMDSGIYVLAVDTGIVTFTQDGLFDRNMTSVPSLGLGNYIALKHSNLLYTYYGHLKKYSLLVSIGDTVLPGQRIAKIGSSGNSTDPHLHFELWYDSSYFIDPFKGSCGNSISYWKNTIVYDTVFNIWESGLINFVPILDSLRERGTPREYFHASDNYVTYWNLQYGIKNGDSTRIEWYKPNGSLHFKYTNYYSQDWHFYYYYSYIPRPAMSLVGKWKYKYYYNNNEVDTGHFYIGLNVNLKEKSLKKVTYKIISDSKIEVILPQNYLGKSATIYSLTGKLISVQNIENQKNFKIKLPKNEKSSVFLIRIKHSEGVATIKVVNYITFLLIPNIPNKPLDNSLKTVFPIWRTIMAHIKNYGEKFIFVKK